MSLQKGKGALYMVGFTGVSGRPGAISSVIRRLFNEADSEADSKSLIMARWPDTKPFIG